MAVTMPTTSPSMVTSGPPELPGLAAASNWMRFFISCLPSGERNDPLQARHHAADTEGPMPNGKPTAITLSPGARSEVERMVAAIRSSGILLRLQHRQVVLGLHAGDGGGGFQAVGEDDLDLRSAPETTCRLVRITPLSMITTPVPTPRSTSVAHHANDRGPDDVGRSCGGRGEGGGLHRAQHGGVDVFLRDRLALPRPPHGAAGDQRRAQNEEEGEALAARLPAGAALTRSGRM
jgi:hypothetical protein